MNTYIFMLLNTATRQIVERQIMAINAFDGITKLMLSIDIVLYEPVIDNETKTVVYYEIGE